MTQLQAMTTAVAADPHALSVTGLRRAYGAVTVLDGVDLAVSPGSLTAVLGRSGCGKTTLLRLVAGFDRPDGGTVVLGGREVAGLRASMPPEQRRIGYVAQEGNLFPHLPVAANITFGLPRRARRTRERVAELLELVGLDARYADRYPHELSGGQQQRVALARALAPRPCPPRAPRRCWSPTTSRRRCRWPTGSPSCARAGSSRTHHPRSSTGTPPTAGSRSSSATS